MASSAAVRLLVRPLPAPPPEAGTFTGAVGHFTLRSRITPDNATVGRAITWSLTFSGTGNWPAIKQLPERTLPASFKTLKALRSTQVKDQGLFDGTLTEDLVLIPGEAGRVALGPLRWSYFDPQLERYLTLTAEAVVLNVAPGEAPARPAASAAWQPPGADSGKEGAAEAPRLPPPALRDPIGSLGDSTAPGRASAVYARVEASWLVLLPVWLSLAWWRMRRRDPLQRLRAARRGALRLLEELAHASDPSRVRQLLEGWQAETAAMWRLPQAVPTPSDFGAFPEWRQLWREANAARFGPASLLPADWNERARAAVVGHRVPPLRFWKVLRPRHLLPLLAFVATGSSVRAIPAETLYRTGNFGAAEAAWRSAVEQHTP